MPAMTTLTATATPFEAQSTDAPAPRTRTKAKNPIPVRAMGFPFEGNVPRYWLLGSPIATHYSNALNSLFPEGERFFIRSVKHYVDRIQDDPELVKRVKGFFGQEGRHGHEHERWNRILEAQGYEIESFLEEHSRVAYEVLEPKVPPSLRLAVTAALEHFTASMAANGLTGELLDHADPIMAGLLRWHAAEEIEHKSVAFDVFMKVDGRYSVRVAGLFVALAGLLVSWRAATKHLLAQEAKLGTDLRARAEWDRRNPVILSENDRRARMFRRAIRDYLRPDFHPDQKDDYGLAKGYLESIGRLEG
jgi:predicted metal-dependent hydrolase